MTIPRRPETVRIAKRRSKETPSNVDTAVQTSNLHSRLTEGGVRFVRRRSIRRPRDADIVSHILGKPTSPRWLQTIWGPRYWISEFSHKSTTVSVSDREVAMTRTAYAAVSGNVALPASRAGTAGTLVHGSVPWAARVETSQLVTSRHVALGSRRVAVTENRDALLC